jgi:hypothetical protein
MRKTVLFYIDNGPCARTSLMGVHFQRKGLRDMASTMRDWMIRYCLDVKHTESNLRNKLVRAWRVPPRHPNFENPAPESELHAQTFSTERTNLRWVPDGMCLGISDF